MSLLLGVLMPGHRRITSQSAATGFSRWRYRQIAADDDWDYSSPAYDDSAWPVGAAPFGQWEDGRDDGYTLPPTFDARFQHDYATTWDVNTRLWLRRTLTLTTVPSKGYLMTSFIEDNCHVYINGTLVFDSPDNPNGGSGFRTSLAASAFHVGVNYIAVRCDDEPVSSGVSVTYADFLFDSITEEKAKEVVSCLLRCNGADGSTTFVDDTGITWTQSGNAAISTAHPEFDGGSCAYFDGSGDWVQTPGTSKFAFGTGDFEVEFDVLSTDSNFVPVDFFIKMGLGPDLGWQVIVPASGKLAFYTDSQVIEGSIIVNDGSHHRCSISRSAGVLRTFVDGVLCGSVANSQDLNGVASVLAIGAQVYSRNDTYDTSGYVGQLRITKGVAWHTTDYVPAPFSYP